MLPPLYRLDWPLTRSDWRGGRLAPATTGPVSVRVSGVFER